MSAPARTHQTQELEQKQSTSHLRASQGISRASVLSLTLENRVGVILRGARTLLGDREEQPTVKGISN